MTQFAPIDVAPARLENRDICIVIAALGAGGAERVVAWLAAHWLTIGARVTVISFDRADDAIYHRFPDQVRFVRLGIGASDGPRRLTPSAVRRMVALRGSLKALKPDLVVSFLTKINVLTLCATIGMALPVAVAERNNPLRQPAHWLWQAILRRAYRRADAIICQTRSSIACIPVDCRDRVTVIPNPVLTPTAAATGAPRTIVGVGRLEAQKGFDLLIEAFAAIANDHPGWTLDIWGTGPDEASLRSAAAAYGVAKRMRFRGLSERPGGWIAETGIFVLSSRYEGFPNVLGEAMAAGFPVIAADCDFGPADLVTDGVDGLLIASGQSVELAVALDRLLRDAALRQALAARAPRVAERFAAPKVAALWDGMAAMLLVHARNVAQLSNSS